MTISQKSLLNKKENNFSNIFKTKTNFYCNSKYLFLTNVIATSYLFIHIAARNSNADEVKISICCLSCNTSSMGSKQLNFPIVFFLSFPCVIWVNDSIIPGCVSTQVVKNSIIATFSLRASTRPFNRLTNAFRIPSSDSPKHAVKIKGNLATSNRSTITANVGSFGSSRW